MAMSSSCSSSSSSLSPLARGRNANSSFSFSFSFSVAPHPHLSVRQQKPLLRLRLRLSPSTRRDNRAPAPLVASASDKGGPPPAVLERFQGVIDQLFHHRIVRLGGPLEDDVANVIVSQLLYLDSLDPTADILLLINSPGGSVTAGMAIFDTMKHIRAPVATVCVGLAASMAGFLLGAGSRGKRFSLPNARIMIHQPMGGAQGSQSDMEIQANEVLHHRAVLSGYLAYHTGQPLHTILQDTDRDFFMSAKEAKDYGLVDHVITNPLKALQPQPQP